jgi:hypothetical protein
MGTQRPNGSRTYQYENFQADSSTLRLGPASVGAEDHVSNSIRARSDSALSRSTMYGAAMSFSVRREARCFSNVLLTRRVPTNLVTCLRLRKRCAAPGAHG